MYPAASCYVDSLWARSGVDGWDDTSRLDETCRWWPPDESTPPLEDLSLVAEFFKKFSSDFDKCLFLIETHSEHLILKTQGLIKESPDYSKDNQILFIEKTFDDENNSNSTIQKISFDEKGYMSDDFPDDFFDISYKLYSQLTS